MNLTETQKQNIKHKLLQLLSSNKFAKFYNDGGEFDKYIRGDFEVGSREHTNNIIEVDKTVTKFVEELINID
jgi:hypothetical protein